MNKQQIIDKLRERLPNLLGIYAFGSRVTGYARPDSDLDLAVLLGGYAEDYVSLWELSNELSDIAGIDFVDLLDFREVGTVMQNQIITTGERWWAADEQADIYEAAALSDMQELNSARAELLEEVTLSGRIYAR